jgi:hypothetical protein
MRSFPVLLFSMLFVIAAPAQETGLWIGAAEYLPGLTLTKVMQRIGASKPMIMRVNPNGQVNGTMAANFDKTAAAVEIKAQDRQYNFQGRYDATRKIMLIALTVPDPNANADAHSYLRNDSVYYNYSIQQLKDSMIITLTANAVLNKTLFYNKNPGKEWMGYEQGVAEGMPAASKYSDMHLLPMRLRLVKQTPGSLPPPPREKEIQHTIYLDTSFIKIDVYDNGEIDGDIATIILDGKMIISSQPLSAKAASISLELEQGIDEHILELFADNLGNIPPNTALLVLTCNKKRYELNLSSNGKMNGSVRLVIKK